MYKFSWKIIIFERINIEIVINQVELKLGNTKVAGKIKLKLMKI